jgi:Cu/Zn superoxide dismutase
VGQLGVIGPAQYSGVPALIASVTSADGAFVCALIPATNTAKVTLGEGANSVFAGGGTALMIHAKADDLKSDPSGNVGDRIACGVISK